MTMDMYERDRLSYLQREAAEANLNRAESRELAVFVKKLAHEGATPGADTDDGLVPGEVRLADAADDVGSAHLIVRQAKRAQRYLALPVIVSTGLLAYGVLLLDLALVLIGAFLTVLAVGTIVALHVHGHMPSVSRAEQSERRTEVAYSRLHRRLPDAADRAIAAREDRTRLTAIEAAKKEAE